MHRKPDIVVIGGGAAGCGVAWRLAEGGANVLLVERAEPGAGATRAAAGMLTPEAEAAGDAAFLRLGRCALERWPAFARAVHEASGVDPGFIRSGRIALTVGAAAAGAHDAPNMPAAGNTLSTEDLHRLEPALAARETSAWLFPDDASADPRALATALARAAAHAGVRMIQDEALAVACAPDGVQAVVLRDGGQVATSAVVIAAGAWASALHGLPATPAIRPVRGDMLAVHADEPVLQHIIWAPGCYLVPRPNGRVLIGATVEDVGFAPGPSLAGITALASAAARVCPALGSLPVSETWCGYRPASSDGLPVLGADSRVRGVFHAGGLFRNGILLAPVVADGIAHQILGREPLDELRPFAPDRSTGG